MSAMVEGTPARAAGRRWLGFALAFAALTIWSGWFAVTRLSLTRELGAVSANQPTGRQVGGLGPAIFHTMAEVAVLLSQPLPPDELFLQEKPEHA